MLNDRFGEEISRLLQGVIPLSKHFDKLKYEIPYILQLKSDKQKFIYFGMDHSKEPSLEELNMMENLFEEFISNSNKNGSVLALEFLKKYEADKTGEDKEMRGQKKILNLAKNSGMEVICPEMHGDDISSAVLKSKKFTPVQVASWIFINSLWGILLAGISKDAIQKVEALLSQLKEDFDIISIDEINQELSRSTDLNIRIPMKAGQIELEDINKEILRKAQSPFQNHGRMNEIGVEMNYVRELFITANILKVLLEGKNLFAVYGANHVVSQEPVFRRYFSK